MLSSGKIHTVKKEEIFDIARCLRSEAEREREREFKIGHQVFAFSSSLFFGFSLCVSKKRNGSKKLPQASKMISLASASSDDGKGLSPFGEGLMAESFSLLFLREYV